MINYCWDNLTYANWSEKVSGSSYYMDYFHASNLVKGLNVFNSGTSDSYYDGLNRFTSDKLMYKQAYEESTYYVIDYGLLILWDVLEEMNDYGDIEDWTNNASTKKTDNLAQNVLWDNHALATDGIMLNNSMVW